VDDTVEASSPADPPTDAVAWRRRLHVDRATMEGIRQDTARVARAIAATERVVARTLHALAAEDRARGRTAAADRRDARAQEAERFAAREGDAADRVTEATAPRDGGP